MKKERCILLAGLLSAAALLVLAIGLGMDSDGAYGEDGWESGEAWDID